MRNWVLIIPFMFLLAGCQTSPIVKTEIVYITKPKLDLYEVKKPVINDNFKFTDSNGLICLDPESMKAIANNNLELSRYIQELQINFDIMKRYYEDPIVSKTVE